MAFSRKLITWIMNLELDLLACHLFSNQATTRMLTRSLELWMISKKLVDGMHDREIKVVLDLIPEHTAEQTKELSAVMKFWITQGVDGFRVPTTGYVSEANQESDLDQTLDLLKRFREVLDGDEENPGSKILMTNVAPSSDIAKFYGVNVTDQVGSLSQMPVNDESFLPDAKITAENLKKSIEDYIKKLPDNAWPNFSLGKHGKSRVATRTSPKHINALNMLLMMLPGTPITYYGEEIGMVDGSGMDVTGTAMQWNADAAADAAAEENSHTKIYHGASSLRESETLLFGSLEMRVDGDVFILARVKKGNPGYIFVTNFGDSEKIVSVMKDSETENPTEIPNMADKGILTIGTPKNPELEVGASVNMAKITVPPGTSYLITFVPDF